MWQHFWRYSGNEELNDLFRRCFTLRKAIYCHYGLILFCFFCLRQSLSQDNTGRASSWILSSSARFFRPTETFFSLPGSPVGICAFKSRKDVYYYCYTTFSIMDTSTTGLLMLVATSFFCNFKLGLNQRITISPLLRPRPQYMEASRYSDRLGLVDAHKAPSSSLCSP